LNTILNSLKDSRRAGGVAGCDTGNPTSLYGDSPLASPAVSSMRDSRRLVGETVRGVAGGEGSGWDDEPDCMGRDPKGLRLGRPFICASFSSDGSAPDRGLRCGAADEWDSTGMPCIVVAPTVEIFRLMSASIVFA
jgi:hypothetical protein